MLIGYNQSQKAPNHPFEKTGSWPSFLLVIKTFEDKCLLYFGTDMIEGPLLSLAPPLRDHANYPQKDAKL